MGLSYGGVEMRVGMLVNVDKLGRVVIPKGYREFYHIEKNGKLCLIDTADGLLITNPKYKVVKIEQDENRR